jgi:hypothetical protein
VARALVTGEPLAPLMVASALLAATDPRDQFPFGPSDDVPAPLREDMVQVLFAVPRVETASGG